MNKIVKRLFYKFPASHVFMFHHIDDGKIIKKSGCVIRHEEFVKILDSSLNFISIDDYVKFSSKTKNKVVISFDDGLQDVYRVAYPELKSRNIPFTIFIVTEFLDKEGYLTTQQLLKLSSDPLVTIGSHGVSHRILKGMDYEQQKIELLESKRHIEKLIQKDVKYFAYSHGQYDNFTLFILNETKCYDFAFGTCGYPTNIYTKRWKYYLPRINCDEGQTRFVIKGNKVKMWVL